MESFQDQGIVLSVVPHGENGGIVSLLTEQNGRHAGYVRGARSSRMRGTLEAGNVVDCNWQSRLAENLGTYALELSRAGASAFLDEPLKLAMIQSACALCDAALPEREGHSGLFHGFVAFLDALETEVWAESYIMWEMALLKELGFFLDLSRCAGGGNTDALAYVSPKTGRAVSLEAGKPYKDKLLRLPQFLGGVGEQVREESSQSPYEQDIRTALTLTGHFLEHWVFNHHTKGVPKARLVLAERFS